MNSSICDCISPILYAHVQNDFDSCKIHAKFACQIQNHFEPFKVAVPYKAGISLRTRRLQ